MTEQRTPEKRLQFHNGYATITANGELLITADGYSAALPIGEWSKLMWSRFDSPQPEPQSAPRRCFPGTASMFASRRNMAVTTEWLRGWNACLDEIDQLGGFNGE